ncbi:hypothetical protein ZWY2020_044798 [Hordeum vulgare]|nr:hypothetical protein ZWY2020_044798 [Hordeum vulgare]
MRRRRCSPAIYLFIHHLKSPKPPAPNQETEQRLRLEVRRSQGPPTYRRRPPQPRPLGPRIAGAAPLLHPRPPGHPAAPLSPPRPRSSLPTDSVSFLPSLPSSWTWRQLLP